MQLIEYLRKCVLLNSSKNTNIFNDFRNKQFLLENYYLSKVFNLWLLWVELFFCFGQCGL